MKIGAGVQAGEAGAAGRVAVGCSAAMAVTAKMARRMRTNMAARGFAFRMTISPFTGLIACQV
jgi:hypothetical protein